MKKKTRLKKLTLTAKVKTKIPIKIAGKTMMVDGDAEFPINLIYDGRKQVGVLTAEELKKYEKEKGELEVLKGKLEKAQKENSRKLTELERTAEKSLGKTTRTLFGSNKKEDD
jgi:hypothetical protein